jgi:SH3-like domain-containing protein
VKLEEADAQVKAGHLGSAMFFVYRAERIASDLQLESEQVARAPSARFVRAARANLRSDPHTESEVVLVLNRGTPVFPEAEHSGWLLVRTPAGSAGWIYTDLVSEPAATTQSLPASLAR